MIAAGLTRAIQRAGIPIIGVSIGVEADRATWSVQFKPEATSQHRTDAAALVASYDLATDAALKDEEAASGYDGLKALKAALLTSLWGRLGRQPTAAEIGAERTRFLTIYKSL